MGAELIKRVKQCETMTQEALVVTKEMKATAARYCEEATRRPSNSGMLPDDRGGAQNLHGAEGKDRCSAHGSCMT